MESDLGQVGAADAQRVLIEELAGLLAEPRAPRLALELDGGGLGARRLEEVLRRARPARAARRTAGQEGPRTGARARALARGERGAHPGGAAVTVSMTVTAQGAQVAERLCGAARRSRAGDCAVLTPLPGAPTGLDSGMLSYSDNVLFCGAADLPTADGPSDRHPPPPLPLVPVVGRRAVHVQADLRGVRLVARATGRSSGRRSRRSPRRGAGAPTRRSGCGRGRSGRRRRRRSARRRRPGSRARATARSGRAPATPTSPRRSAATRARCGRASSPSSGRRSSPRSARVDLQDFADRLLAEGLDPSTIRNTLMPLRAIYRRALTRGDVAVNPTTGLELPAVRGRRDRVADPRGGAAADRRPAAARTGRSGRRPSTRACGAAS